jgi:hypothetical protein
MSWSFPFSRSSIARSLASHSGLGPQEVALLQAIACRLGRFPLLPIPHALITPPTCVQIRIGFGLHGFDHGFVLQPPLALITPITFTDRPIDAAIERIAVGCRSPARGVRKAWPHAACACGPWAPSVGCSPGGARWPFGEGGWGVAPPRTLPSRLKRLRERPINSAAAPARPSRRAPAPRNPHRCPSRSTGTSRSGPQADR